MFEHLQKAREVIQEEARRRGLILNARLDQKNYMVLDVLQGNYDPNFGISLIADSELKNRFIGKGKNRRVEPIELPRVLITQHFYTIRPELKIVPHRVRPFVLQESEDFQDSWSIGEILAFIQKNKPLICETDSGEYLFLGVDVLKKMIDFLDSVSERLAGLVPVSCSLE